VAGEGDTDAVPVAVALAVALAVAAALTVAGMLAFAAERKDALA